MLHCLISGRPELRWNLFSPESLLSSHDELVGGLVGEGLAPVGGAAVVVGADRLWGRSPLDWMDLIRWLLGRDWCPPAGAVRRRWADAAGPEPDVGEPCARRSRRRRRKRADAGYEPCARWGGRSGRDCAAWAGIWWSLGSNLTPPAPGSFTATFLCITVMPLSETVPLSGPPSSETVPSSGTGFEPPLWSGSASSEGRSERSGR